MGIITSLAKTAAWLGSGYVASSFIDDEAKKATTTWGRVGLGAASLAVTYKSFQGALKTGTNDLRRFATENRKALALGSPGREFWGSAFRGSTQANRFVSKFGVRGAIKGAFGLAGSVAKGTPGFLASPVTGAVEYGQAFARTAGKPPGAFFAAMTEIKSPEAPFVGLGLLAGGYAAVQNDQYSHKGMVRAPSFFGMDQGPVNHENFGGGISYGRSALRSPTVVGGQAAVTNRMLQKRRV